MMKIRFYFLVFFTAAINLTSAIAQNPAEKLKQVFNRTHKEILVVAHRGDWRNAPENSLHALLNSIDRGFDMMELDVKMTKDSQMVVMHDNTIDRTTNGKGKVSDFTLEEIRKFKLRNGLGRVTANPIPTFKELMRVAKNKILINVDKGNDHLPEVFKVLQETGTLQQAVVNVGDNIPFENLVSTEKIPAEAYIMVVVNMTNPNALKIIKGYGGSKKSVIQPIFNTDTLTNLKQLPQIAKKQVVWLNSLWPSLNGGHDDDRAVEQNQKPESWGWLLDFNPLFIQSDRPADLIKYLKERKLHQ
ncbi:glycerophosphodiester phosphodiesterase family protein [Pedobacter sp. Leaf41]|uniref:glycerophosphodiester phosphodiesterase family protein n=1 Tax=Pedobacter sp. Leaf41 TaxID=1736218 RepID=UPI0009E70147|nr:glycerophosphodiester phosphodiesterase family protein [Pedobacter sp. Leaf41]RZK64114.1 MAG: glycerophosphodiester phosphodiesterase family protein [Pedobacter sp.]